MTLECCFKCPIDDTKCALFDKCTSEERRGCVCYRDCSPYKPACDIGRRIKEASEDDLTPEEIADVEEAWAEIERGEAKSFTNVEGLLRELKEASE